MPALNHNSEQLGNWCSCNRRGSQKEPPSNGTAETIYPNSVETEGGMPETRVPKQKRSPLLKLTTERRGCDAASKGKEGSKSKVQGRWRDVAAILRSWRERTRGGGGSKRRGAQLRRKKKDEKKKERSAEPPQTWAAGPFHE